jgi:hypothetical protein
LQGYFNIHNSYPDYEHRATLEKKSNPDHLMYMYVFIKTDIGNNNNNWANKDETFLEINDVFGIEELPEPLDKEDEKDLIKGLNGQMEIK